MDIQTGQEPHPHPHGAPAGAEHDVEVPEIDLMTPLTIRGAKFRNRMVMSPMCQYSAEEGMANDWHLVHLGSRAAGGVGLVIVEATSVTWDGRISPADLGIWSDDHMPPLARIAQFIRSQGAMVGIQLAHAGRKGSSRVPWEGGAAIPPDEEGGWVVVAPSPIPFIEGDPVPRELDKEEIELTVRAFVTAAERALTAGFNVLEVHAAHGYLLHQFLSPLCNKRTDEYGGSFENRIRLLLRVVGQVREVMPEELPLFVRLSATDWIEGGWDIDQSVELAKRLKAINVDVIDVSTGGAVPKARIPMGKGYQVPCARRIRDEADIMTGAVGLITDVPYANDLVIGGDADLVLLGRELLREPYWALKAAQEMDCEPDWPKQYAWAVKRRTK
jgi:2,4-dienoyl-CoA reductase-like NADH-dependent reductase (Old Yellow Enzyme family)